MQTLCKNQEWHRMSIVTSRMRGVEDHGNDFRATTSSSQRNSRRADLDCKKDLNHLRNLMRSNFGSASLAAREAPISKFFPFHRLPHLSARPALFHERHVLGLHQVVPGQAFQGRRALSRPQGAHAKPCKKQLCMPRTRVSRTKLQHRLQSSVLVDLHSLSLQEAADSLGLVRGNKNSSDRVTSDPTCAF